MFPSESGGSLYCFTQSHQFCEAQFLSVQLDFGLVATYRPGSKGTHLNFVRAGLAFDVRSTYGTYSSILFDNTRLNKVLLPHSPGLERASTQECTLSNIKLLPGLLPTSDVRKSRSFSAQFVVSFLLAAPHRELYI